ncbi:MAG: AsmA family protein [Pseudomonadales bacterium]|nr:AsmA family protein [Pseudomonadales bacterium]
MKKLVNYLLVALAGLVVAAVLAVLILFVAVDPNRYKPALAAVFSEQTGLDLNIAGDISWSFRPVFGLSIADVRLRNLSSPQELASFSSVSLKVAPASLLAGPLRIEEFIATDLNINWIVDSNGQSNWTLPTASTGSPGRQQTQSTGSAQAQPQGQGQTEASEIDAEIQLISLQNARISIQDASRKLNTTIENLSLVSSNTNFSNRPFPVEISFRLLDNASARELPMTLSSLAAIDLNAGSVSLNELEFNLSPLLLNGTITISDFNGDMSWQGAVQARPFNLAHFLENFSPPDSQNPIPGSLAEEGLFALSARFNGDSNGISVPELALHLDQMQVRTDIEYRYATPSQKPRLAYTLTANALDLNAFTASNDDTVTSSVQDQDQDQDQLQSQEQTQQQALAPVTSATSAASTPPTSIPVELLNSINIIGTHSIESLAIAGLNLGQIDLRLGLENGLLDLETQPVDFYDGQLAALLQLDIRPRQPLATVTLAMENVNLPALATDLPLAGFASGRLNIASQHELQGYTTDQMLASIKGSSSFNISENSVDISLIKQVFGAISALSPSGDMAQDWPDTISFSNLSGSLQLSEGLASGQALALRLDNLDVAGNGGIDLAAGSFDYAIDVTVLGEPAVQTIRLNPTYQGIAWPITCAAEFSAAPSQYCGPNFEAVRTLFAQIGRNEVQRRVEETVSDNVPAELQDTTRGLLRNLFRR